MQNHSLLRAILVAAVSFLMSGCATTTAPSGWLSDPNQVSSDPYGGWVDIHCKNERIMGELIAVTKDTLFVANDLLHAVGSADILTARLAFYHPSNLGGVVALGTISTLSHGFILILSAPLWLIVGSVTAYLRSDEPLIDYPEKPLEKFVPFARFPQGLPPGLDRQAILMKYMVIDHPDAGKVH